MLDIKGQTTIFDFLGTRREDLQQYRAHIYEVGDYVVLVPHKSNRSYYDDMEHKRGELFCIIELLNTDTYAPLGAVIKNDKGDEYAYLHDLIPHVH